MEQLSKQYVRWLLALITLVHVLGMALIDIMEVDAAQYASISQEMLQTGEYLQVHHRYEDYLDKPPLLFWVTSLSFKVFGAGNFAYRLPSFLFLLLGVWATYRLGRHLYDERTGLLAALVLYCSQAYFLFAHDVRTDTILANVVVFAIWQLWLFVEQRRFANLLWGAVGVALAMLEKGPIGLMVPVLALGSQVLFSRNLRVLWRWEWLAGLAVIALLLAPMCYGLYQQFGWHGLKFYFWTQSFGRITGESEWRDNSTVFYFVHTFLWAFLPWMLVAYYGVIRDWYVLVKNKFTPGVVSEVLTLCGFTLTFIAMSLSRYKLPHYIFVVFPLVAIITAKTLWYIIDNRKHIKAFTLINWLLWAGLWMAAGLLSYGTFSGAPWWVAAGGVLLLVASFYYLVVRKEPVARLIYAPVLTIVGVNFMLNTWFYPTLLTYQAGSMAGRYIAAQAGHPPVYSLGLISHGLDFYSGRVATNVEAEELRQMPGVWVYTGRQGKAQLDSLGIEYVQLKTFKKYPVTQLTMEFLRPTTRDKVVGTAYLLEIKE